jgi:hypothetical protein
MMMMVKEMTKRKTRVVVMNETVDEYRDEGGEKETLLRCLE